MVGVGYSYAATSIAATTTTTAVSIPAKPASGLVTRFGVLRLLSI